jgi:hypothetical protein
MATRPTASSGWSRREMLRVAGGATIAAGLHGWMSERSAFAAMPAPHLRLQAVDFSVVELHGGFWSPKQGKVATRTFAACIYQTEVNTGRIRNFEKADEWIAKIVAAQLPDGYLIDGGHRLLPGDRQA